MAADVALAARIRAASLLSGRFRLRSGRTSNTYFDKYLFESDPELLADLVAAMRSLVPAHTDVLAGLEMGGIPLVTMLSAATGLPARFVRKKAKEYGTCRVAEGGEVAGLDVVLVEDVITSGGAVLAAARALREQGARVRHVLCAIDRQEGGRERLAEIGLTLRAALTRADLDTSTAGEGKAPEPVSASVAHSAPTAVDVVAPFAPANDNDSEHLVTLTADEAAGIADALEAATARMGGDDPTDFDATVLVGRARELARQLRDRLPSDRVVG